VKPQRRIDADVTAWQKLRDDLHALALEHGSTWLALAQKTSVCPKGISGRAYELWQPLLALASWVESYGADKLLPMMQRFALDSIDGARDDQIPDADQALLEILADKLRIGDRPTPGEICDRAKERDKATFDKWSGRTVSNRLRPYGLVAKKYDRRREYRYTLADLARIQRNYMIDLGVPDETAPETASPASPFVPETPFSGTEAPGSGRSGTQRDAS
jgi:hypothetical protein